MFPHGSPGGCDQGVLLTRFLAGSHRVIVISWPGYLGTPLTPDTRAPAAQAELIAAVLDALGIERFALMCWSGGGPAAYSLAAAVPDRVASMVAVAAVSTRFDPRSSVRGRLEPSEEKLLFNRFGQWLATTPASRAPSTAISTLRSGEGDLSRVQIRALTASIVADDHQRGLAIDLFDTVSGVRKSVFDNDFDQSVHAVDKMPGACLEVIDEGTHLSRWLGPDAPRLQALVAEHLTAAARGNSQRRSPDPS